MQMGINHKFLSFFAKTLVVCAACAVCPVIVGASDGPIPVKLTDAQIEAMSKAEFLYSPNPEFRHPKLDASLLEISDALRIRADWRSAAVNRGLLVEGESVLVEMRLNPESARAAEWYLRNLGGRIRHHNVPSLMEVWLPVKAIEKSAENKDVHHIRPARLVEPTVGSVTSEGVAALNINTGSVDYDYHDLGVDGSGVTIASIDAGYSGYAALQTSGDWPQPANLERYEVDGSAPVNCDSSTCSNYEASSHGAATMEIVFDVAPGADYLTYRTTTVGDWYTALIHAANNGADVVTVSLSAPLDNVGDGSICPPNFTAPCGTIAEAAAYARSQGTLVVNSAGNNRLIHWGGTYRNRRSYHDWGGRETYNTGGPGGGYVYCYPDGYPLGVDLFWDDWTDVDHDYDLLLYEWDGSDWLYRAGSFAWQNGSAGQTPQEGIRYSVSGAIGAGGICGAGSGMFAFRIQRYSAATSRNFQVFAGNWGGLEFSTPDRSLGFPADSPDIYAAGAVDVASPSTLEDYSAEGPVLGPGGSQAAPSPANPKPDGVSVSGVSTVSYGPAGFGGTSSAAPHIAGVAAVLTQLRNEKYATPPTSNNPDGMANQLSLFALEDPTFPSIFDTTYGNGLVKLRFCNQTVNVVGEEFIMLGLPCNPRGLMTVGDVLGDIVNGDFGLWTWDAATETYAAIHSLPSPATFEMEPGVGYWLWYESNASVSMQGLVRDRTEPYRIELVGEDGGLGRDNLLGFTFDVDVAWPDVRVYYQGNDLSLAEAYTFDGGVLRNFMWKPYTATGYDEWNGTAAPPEGTFNGFDGFWVKAWKDCELGIPVSSPVVTAIDGPVFSERSSGWTVRLDATIADVTASARIGQLSSATLRWDAFDAELMPSAEAHQFYVVVPHDDWNEYAGPYVRDYHGERRTDAWEFEVRSNVGGTVLLRWDGPSKILEQSVVIDLETGTAIPAVKIGREGYKFVMSPGVREFVWRVR
jgi:Subtilase family